jgi:hypothetical protein
MRQFLVSPFHSTFSTPSIPRTFLKFSTKMLRPPSILLRLHLRPLSLHFLPQRTFSAMPGAVPLKTKHLLSIADLSVPELHALLARSAELKHSVKKRGLLPGMSEFTPGPLAGESVAMMFSKRSTRTRVSTESAVALLGGHPMFLGKDDIQLGVRPPSPISIRGRFLFLRGF